MFVFIKKRKDNFLNLRNPYEYLVLIVIFFNFK